MKNANIAIVGLEHHGTQLLELLVGCGNTGPNIVCAVALEDGAGRRKAEACGIAMVELDRLVQLSDGVDIIFDLTRDAAMHDRLHQALAACGNHHTQLLSENAMELISILLAERPALRAA